jgi:hypothetical protein
MRKRKEIILPVEKPTVPERTPTVAEAPSAKPAAPERARKVVTLPDGTTVIDW